MNDPAPLQSFPAPTDLTPRAMGTPPDHAQLGPAFHELVEVIAKLRSPSGCPWDREQTLATIKPFTLEETYELLEAIDSNDDTAIVEELGDVLFNVLFLTRIAEEQGHFTLKQVIDGGETNYISATLAIYLDLFNIFQSMLALLGIFGGERD